MTNSSNINNHIYWDARFTKDWESGKGPTQSRFFARIAIEHLPSWLIEQIKRESLTLTDWGCAQGDGTDVWTSYISAQQIVGIDFSSVAIEQAGNRYPAIHFRAEDWLSDSCVQIEKFDVVFSSNTLEHFHKPYDVLRALLHRAKKAVVLVLPYREIERVCEHFFTFLPENVPNTLPGNFRLVWSQVVDCSHIPDTCWGGAQIILVYAESSWVNSLELTLQDFRVEHEDFVSEKNILSNLVIERDKQITSLSNLVIERDKQITSLNQNIKGKVAHEKYAHEIYSSYTKIQSAYLYRFIDLEISLREKFHRVKNRGCKIVKHKIINKVIYSSMVRKVDSVFRYILSIFSKNTFLNRLKDLTYEKPVIVFRPIIDWNVPLFQRPQHLAINLARSGYQYIYCSPQHYDSDLKPLQKSDIVDGLWMSGSYWMVENYILNNSKFPQKYIHVYAQDVNFTVEEYEKFINSGVGIIYEYIDAITEDLSVDKNKILERHEKVLRNESVVVIATANSLIQEIKTFRQKNFLKITNGVDYYHFSNAKEKSQKFNHTEELKEFIASGDAVIGYFGALASWFDYEAISHLAKERPNYRILLLGWNYDGSMDKYDFGSFSNIKVLGPINYSMLPDYAGLFDVATIPFIINDITLATNPIKLFEYMAIGTPVVTSDLPECRIYQSAIIYTSKEDFIDKIDRALELRTNNSYRKCLDNEAKMNTWQSKADTIAGFFQIRDIQDQLSCLYTQDVGPDSYYVTEYAKTEIFYWQPVLGWIRQLKNITSVLDIGAAYGTLLIYSSLIHNIMSNYAIDPVCYMSEQVKKRYDIKHLNFDYEREVIEIGRKFDLILFTEVIEHLNFHPLATLNKIKSLLTLQGSLILTTPDAAEWGQIKTYYNSLEEIPVYNGQDSEWIDGHVWQYSRDELESLFDQAGFEIESFDYSPGVVGRHLCYLLKVK